MIVWRIRGVAPAVFAAFLASVAAPVTSRVHAASAPASDAPPADVARPPKDARSSPSGVFSKILEPGHGRERAERNDCVTALYTIWKRDGTLLGGTRSWSQPGSTCLRSMFPGMAEAVRSMAPGERRRIWIPANMSYAGGDDDQSKPLDLTVDFALLAIQKAPPVPLDLKAPPPTATKLGSGVAFRRLKKGNGNEHPLSKSQMSLDFSGWTTNGDLIESTVMAGRPASYDLVSSLRGWREVLQLMVVGDKVRVWIPAAMAFGKKPRRGQPKGDLVYELELLSLQ